VLQPASTGTTVRTRGAADASSLRKYLM